MLSKCESRTGFEGIILVYASKSTMMISRKNFALSSCILACYLLSVFARCCEAQGIFQSIPCIVKLSRNMHVCIIKSLYFSEEYTQL